MSDDLTAAWNHADSALPAGWRLDSLRCASTGLEPERRSDDWVALAIGPDGATITARAPDPAEALSRLVDQVGQGGQ